MALTNEKAELLTNYLVADKDRAQKLLALTPEEALVEINVDHNDFTVEDLKDFGNQLQQLSNLANETGELNVDDLANVSGGVVVSGTVAAALIAGGITMFGTGLSFGYQVARDRGW